MRHNKTKKIFGLLLALALVSPYISSLSDKEAFAEGLVEIYEDFDGEEHGWQVGKSYSANLATMNISNGILSMTGNAQWSNDAPREPHIYHLIKNGDGIKAEAGKNVVLKTKFKVEDGGNYTYLKINRPTELDDLPDGELQYNYYSVFSFNYGGINYMVGNNASNKGPVETQIAGKRGAWIDLKIVFKPNAEGTAFEKADYYVNVDGVDYEALDKALPTAERATGFTDWTAIRNVTFALKGAEATTSIDYFYLYEVSTMATVSLLKGKTDYISGSDGIVLKFNTDVGNVNEETVILKDKDNNVVEYTGRYEDKLYYIEPNGKIEDGQYHIEIKSDEITIGSPDITNNIASRFDFEYYETAPKYQPYVEDVAISGSAQERETLLGVYSFKDQNGDAENKDATIYKWFTSDSKNGKYTQIEGADKQEYTIKSEDAGKYIKFSVTACSENEPYYAEEVFSNPIGPVVGRIVSDNSFYEDFDEDQGDWKLGKSYSDYVPTITVANGIMTMTGNAKYMNDKNMEPNIYHRVNRGDGIKAEVGKYVAIKTKFKVTSGNYIYMKINRPTELADLPEDEMRYNYYSVFCYNYGAACYMDGNTTNNAPAENTVAPARDKWIDVKIVFKPNAEGTAFEKADYVVTIDGKEYKYYDKTLPTAERESGYTDWEAIRNVTFTVKNDPNTTDIDYFYLYEYPGFATANLVKGEVEYLCGKDDIALEFNSDVLNVNEDTVILKDENKQSVAYSGRYDAKEKRYYILPEDKLNDGIYTIEIKSDEIIPALPDTENKIDSKINFEYYQKTPLYEPYAENVRISGALEERKALVGEYEFKDRNADKEDSASTIYKWFVSNSKNGEYREIEGANRQKYILSDSDVGKYIKFSVTVCSENAPYYGEEVFSEAVGPISPFEDKNYIVNGDFESGAISPWSIITPADDTLKLEVTEGESHSGSYALSVKDKIKNESLWSQSVALDNNKTYIFDGYVKADRNGANDKVLCDGYVRGDVTTAGEAVTAEKENWKQFTKAITVAGSNGGKTTIYPSVQNNAKGDYYVDDLYIGTLRIEDIDVTVPESIKIPETTEAVYKLSGKVLNQKGTFAGLENEKTNFSIDKYDGVFVENNELHITNRASTGTLNLYAECVPEFLGATENDAFVKKVQIELTPNNNNKPVVSNVVLSGTVAEGAVLTVDYDYYQVERKNDTSVLAWYYCDTRDGNYKLIPNAEGKQFTVGSEYKTSYIKVKITPQCEGGYYNSDVWSNVAAYNIPPEASDVSIICDKSLYSGSVLKGSYEYYDMNESPEGVSEYRWLRAKIKNGEYSPIKDANGIEYTLTEDDSEMYIKFEVTPVSEEEPYKGVAYCSEPMMGPAYPVATDVKIKRSGNYLTATYTYSHYYNIKEGESEYKWYVNGKCVGTGASYTAKAGEKVTFEVTPVATKAPFKGKTVSATFTVPSASASSGSGGSGGGSGNKTTVYAPNITNNAGNVLNDLVDKTKYEAVADVSGHWSENYVKKVVEEGIMETDAEKKFYPDEKALRKDVVRWVANAFGLSAEYNNEFADVEKGFGYENELQALVNIGVISKDVNFNPEREISRQEMAKIIVKVLEYKNISCDEISDISGMFKDFDDISDWAKDYVRMVVSYKAMIGVGEDMFAPKNNITKAQIATLICNVLNIIEESAM